jgi:soluble lytic murein transglycosylase-like protein
LPSPTLNGISRWQPIIADAASTFALPESWVAAVMAKESSGRTVMNGKPITSSAGAMGLMQVMPGTYRDLRKQLRLGSDPHAPRDNILAGTAYLRQMYRRYGYPAMFAAYNAGPGRYEDFLYRRRPLPGETLAYIAGIAPGAEIAFGAGKATERSVAASRAGAPRPARTTAIFFAPSAANALFVTRSAPRPAQD